MIVREPVGVVGMITPWNWPLNQIACKVAPALAAGCTMVLKPIEIAPLTRSSSPRSSHEAGVPKGVFNLVNGLRRGSRRGDERAPRHRHDVVHGIDARRHRRGAAAAPTVKRVTQELGGKSPNIILEDADLSKAVAGGVPRTASTTPASPAMRRRACSCRARKHEGGGRDRQGVADKAKVGDPERQRHHHGPGGQSRCSGRRSRA